MSGKRKTGRPSVMNSDVLRKLEFAFAHGLSDREACLLAGIGESTLYDYCKQHAEFSEKKDLLKNQPKMMAKLVIFNALERGDIKAAQWYLERKDKEEFSTKPERTLTAMQAVLLVDDISNIEK